MNTDQQIEKLEALVAEKEKAIEEINNYNLKTNNLFPNLDCSGASVRKTINLNTINSVLVLRDCLARLISERNSVIEANKILEIGETFYFEGYSFDDWVSDIKQRAKKIQISAKKKQLAELKQKLNKLKSPEAKKLQELKEIEELLGK